MKQSAIFILSLLVLSVIPTGVDAQSPENIFVEIEKALKAGDVDSFSIWFSDNIDIDILDASNIYSKNQAKQILKKFFVKYSPKSFTFIHQSGKGKMQYGIGLLVAGGESFRVTIFIQNLGKKYTIPQLRIEKTPIT